MSEHVSGSLVEVELSAAEHEYHWYDFDVGLPAHVPPVVVTVPSTRGDESAAGLPTVGAGSVVEPTGSRMAAVDADVRLIFPAELVATTVTATYFATSAATRR